MDKLETEVFCETSYAAHAALLDPIQSAAELGHILSVDDVPHDQRIVIECPYCEKTFDVWSYCKHIREHKDSMKFVRCPLCRKHVQSGLLYHIRTKHAKLFRDHRRRTFLNSSSSEGLSISDQDFREKEREFVAFFGKSGSLLMLPDDQTTRTAGGSLVSKMLQPEKDFNSIEADAQTSESPVVRTDDRNLGPQVVLEEDPGNFDKDGLKSRFVQELLISVLFGDS